MRLTVRINIMPCEGARVACKAWTIGGVCSEGLGPHKCFAQVFYPAEQGYRPIVFSAVQCSLLSVKARWIGYVGDG